VVTKAARPNDYALPHEDSCSQMSPRKLVACSPITPTHHTTTFDVLRSSMYRAMPLLAKSSLRLLTIHIFPDINRSSTGRRGIVALIFFLPLRTYPVFGEVEPDVRRDDTWQRLQSKLCRGCTALTR
jgi:hypothetical protein